MRIPTTINMKADTRDAIVTTLAEKWPLSAKEVYSEVKENQGLNITYQGIHKVLNQLVDERTVVIQDRKYLLSAEWVKTLKKFAETAEKNYLKEKNAPYLQVGTGSSIENDAFYAGREAAEKALKQINHQINNNLRLVLVFASGSYDDYDEILKGIRSITKSAPLAGCSTLGEINNKRLEKSVTTIVFSADESIFSAKIIPITIPRYNEAKTFEESFKILQQKTKLNQKFPEVGLIFFPGYSRENSFRVLTTEFLREFSNKFSPMFPITGCLSGQWSFNTTKQFCNDKIYSDQAVFVAIYTRLKVGTRRSHGYEAISGVRYKLKVRGGIVKEMARIRKGIVGEYKPAREVYTKDSGMTISELTALPEIRALLAQNKTLPITRIADSIHGYPAVLTEDGIQFNNTFEDGDIVEISRTTPEKAISATKEAVKEAIAQGSIKSPNFVLLFSCASLLAILEPHNLDEIEKIKKQLNNVQIAGCYNLAEIGPLSTQQANGTVVALVFGNELRE
ncbi:TPA: hypothetical protein HA244_05895 [Candidatus Micrarchaeota archaeon]|nr:hypothetical protein [Candidatus Micrarchaeota archaeon]